MCSYLVGLQCYVDPNFNQYFLNVQAAKFQAKGLSETSLLACAIIT